MTNYLIHSSKGTTWSKKNHKYTKKYKNSFGTWVYVYKNGFKDLENIDDTYVKDGTVHVDLEDNGRSAKELSQWGSGQMYNMYGKVVKPSAISFIDARTGKSLSKVGVTANMVGSKTKKFFSKVASIGMSILMKERQLMKWVSGKLK